jgi:hypothetical protein
MRKKTEKMTGGRPNSDADLRDSKHTVQKECVTHVYYSISVNLIDHSRCHRGNVRDSTITFAGGVPDTVTCESEFINMKAWLRKPWKTVSWIGF